MKIKITVFLIICIILPLDGQDYSKEIILRINQVISNDYPLLKVYASAANEWESSYDNLGIKDFKFTIDDKPSTIREMRIHNSFDDGINIIIIISANYFENIEGLQNSIMNIIKYSVNYNIINQLSENDNLLILSHGKEIQSLLGDENISAVDAALRLKAKNEVNNIVVTPEDTNPQFRDIITRAVNLAPDNKRTAIIGFFNDADDNSMTTLEDLKPLLYKKNIPVHILNINTVYNPGQNESLNWVSIQNKTETLARNLDAIGKGTDDFKKMLPVPGENINQTITPDEVDAILKKLRDLTQILNDNLYRLKNNSAKLEEIAFTSGGMYLPLTDYNELPVKTTSIMELINKFYYFEIKNDNRSFSGKEEKHNIRINISGSDKQVISHMKIFYALDKKEEFIIRLAIIWGSVVVLLVIIAFLVYRRIKKLHLSIGISDRRCEKCRRKMKDDWDECMFCKYEREKDEIRGEDVNGK